MKSMRLLRYPLLAACLLLFHTLAYGQNPQANFSATKTAGCSPLVVVFFNSSTGSNTPLTYSWNFGNGNTSTKRTPTNIYTAPGKYTVTLTVKDSKGNTNTLTRTDYITVHETPTAKFGAVVRGGCVPFTVQFLDSSLGNSGNITSWTWDFGDGSLSFQQNPTHTYTATGVYDVSLLVRNAMGCQASLVKTNFIYVSDAPQVDFSSPSAFGCVPPVDVKFNSVVTPTVTGPVTYLWDFGDGNSSSQQHPTHTYTDTGKFDVTLTATDSVGCSMSVEKTAYVQVFKEKADFSALVTSGCVPVTVKFNNESDLLPGSTYTWDFGDGTTSNEVSPTHEYKTAQKFTVKLKVITSNGCVDSIEKADYITGLLVPKAAFTASDSLSCKAFTVDFTDQSQNAVSWLWDFGDGDTSTSQNPSHAYAGYDTYSVTLKVTAASGCTHSITKSNLVVINRPFAGFSANPSTGCRPLIVNFGNTTQSTTPISTWEWDFGDATTSSLKNPPAHTYSSTGTYTVELTVTTVDGCVDATTKTIKVGDKPEADFTASPTKACLSQMTVAFTNLTNTHTVQANNFLWDFGDGFTSTSEHPVHTYTDTPGKYTVRLIAFYNGCSDTMIRQDYIEVVPPRARFTYALGKCDPQNVTFTDNSNGPDQWYWDFGDGDTSTVQNPSHTFAFGANYSVRLIVTNDTTGCSDTLTRVVTIPPKLNGYFSTPDTATCVPVTVKFTSFVTEPVSYLWTFGNGTTSTDTNPAVNYASPGAYTITLKITNSNGCTFDTIRTAYIKVYGAIPDFTAMPGAGCVPIKIDFTDKSTSELPIVERIWDFGDGSAPVSTTSATVSHTFTDAADDQDAGVSVTLSVVDAFGCTTKITKTVIPALPKPDFTYTVTPGCGQVTYDFKVVDHDSSGVKPLSFLWRFANGDTSSAKEVTRVYTQFTTETVELTLTDGFSCKRTAVQYPEITVPVLDARFAMNYTQVDCPPLQVSFNDSSTPGFTPIREWEWDFGDGTFSNLQNPQKLFNEAGDYTIRLVVTDTIGCKDTSIMPLHVNGPVGSYSFDKKGGCFPLTVNFTAVTNPGTSILWDFGDGNVDTVNVVSHTYTDPGVYVPVLVISDSSCTYALNPEDTIVVTAKPVADFTVTGQCIGDVTQFTPVPDTLGGTIVKYNWTFGDGGISADTVPSHSYMTTGTYNVTLTMENEWGCSDTVLKKVTIGTVDARIGALNRAVCLGTPIDFRDSTVADTAVVEWFWDFGDGSTDTVQHPSHLYTQKGIFDVTLYTLTATGCTDSAVRQGYIAVGDTIAPKPVRIHRVTTVDDKTLQFEFERYTDIDFASYIIFREVPGGLYFPLDTIRNINDTVVVLNTLDTRHNVYCYKVQAVNLCGVKSDLNATQKHCNINLTATAPLANQVILDWNHYIGWPTVYQYEIYREDVDNPGAFNFLIAVPGTVNFYVDTNIICYKKHVYRVRAVEMAVGNPHHQSWSDTAAAKPVYIGYVAPSEVITTTVEKDRYTHIEWEPSKAKAVKYYFIERSDDGITYQPISMPLSPTTLSYDDKKVFVDSFYYNYRIQVQDSCGDMSQVSNVGRSILLYIDTNSNGYPTLTWTPYLDWPEGVEYYSIELKDNNGNFNEIFKTPNGLMTEHTDAITDLNTQKQYCYRVIAHRADPPGDTGKNAGIISTSNVDCAPLRSVLFVPSAFTPNGDDYNNVFFVKGQYLRDYKLRIFDRWGTLLYESTDMEEGWDGTYKGQTCPMDVYVYMITTRGADNKYRVFKGSITLLP